VKTFVVPFRDNQALVTFGNPTHTKQIWMKLLVPSLATYISNPSKVEYPQDKKHETTEKIYTYFFPATYGKICVILSSATSKKVEKT